VTEVELSGSPIKRHMVTCIRSRKKQHFLSRDRNLRLWSK